LNNIGRLLGVDHGLARIGLALSDPMQVVARPFSILAHTNQRADLRAIARVASENDVAKIVIGLPTDTLGGLSKQALIVIHWARKLRNALSIPIVFWDESYSTIVADEIARANKKRRLRSTDDIAAAAMLQEYLNSLEGNTHETGRPLEAFASLK